MKFLSAIISFIFVLGYANAQEFEYIGAAKCKMCHNKPATGKQYDKWSQLGHANALKSLDSEESWAYAKKNGIADPNKEQSCLECHSTYHRIDQGLNISLKDDEGVSCETCHGPGSRYKPMGIMRNREKAIKYGLIIPDEQLCLECHNEDNPFHKPFNYEEALKKIDHSNPQSK